MSYTYSSHPAWRTSWFSLGLAIVLSLAGAGLYPLPLFELPFRQPILGQQPQDLVGIGILALAALVWLSLLFKHYRWRFVIDDEVVESRCGIIGRELKSVRIKDLRNVNVRQSLFQRIFGVGDVEFSSAGGPGFEVVFSGVLDPIRVRDLVHTLQQRFDIQRNRD